MTKPKAVGVSAAFFVSGIALSVGLTGLGATVLGPGALADPMSAGGLQSAAMLVGFGLATWVFGRRVAGLDSRSLRWHGGARHAALGLAIGAVPAMAAMAVAVPVAGAGWSLDGQPAAEWLRTVLGLAVFLGPAAFAEELVFRGVPLVVLAGAFGRPVALAFTSVLFALAHGLNAHVTPLALANVALAGVFLGLAFYLPGGLVTATAAHLGWNLALAGLAAPVSGLPFAVPWLDYTAGGPAWLSGGGFGPEGGVLATVILGAAAMLAARYTVLHKESSA